MEVSVNGNNKGARMAWIAVAIMAGILAGLAYWQLKPWAGEAEKTRLAGLRDRLSAFYQTHPPMPGWRILSVAVAKPGIVVSLDIPARTAEQIQRRPAVYRLEAAGAICPEPGDPIYGELGRFHIEVHPEADGKPVLVNADCHKVRGLTGAD
jgi:hypothetical protein